MKIILLLTTAITLTSCGVAENLRSACGSDIEMGCNALLGYKNNDQDKEIENLKKKNSEQDAKISEMQAQLNVNISLASDIQNQLNNIVSDIRNTNQDLIDLKNQNDVTDANIQNQITSLNTNLSSLNSSQALLQTQLNTVQGNVAILMTQMLSVNNTLPVLQSNINSLQTQINNLTVTVNQSISSIVDPCGDGPGLDEILLKTKDGKYIAYFESGSNRHLSVLQANTAYQTTDSQHCNFTIDSFGAIHY